MRATRRSILGLTVVVALPPAGAWADAVVDTDGLYSQSWFLQSFLELRDDLKDAAAAGRRLAIFWEQKGCPYCRDMHLVNLAQPEIASYIRERFTVLQLDLHGAREVTDLDGEVYEERAFARRSRVVFTPTIQFLPPTVADDDLRPAVEVEVARMPGYLEPEAFLAMFRYVAEEAYARQGFKEYLATQSGS
jgi:thioredoxin-related protein